MEEIQIYTDGSCYPNDGTGDGGYAFVIVEDGSEVHSQGNGESPSTNNRMEMKAIIDAISFCEQEVPHSNIVIYSDSTYCVNGYNSWMHRWAKKDWEGVANADLCKLLFETKDYNIKWVKGHSDNQWNNKADKLASYKLYNIKR